MKKFLTIMDAKVGDYVEFTSDVCLGYLLIQKGTKFEIKSFDSAILVTNTLVALHQTTSAKVPAVLDLTILELLSGPLNVIQRSNLNINPQPLISHDGHQVVNNEVMGKAFRYCRNCKVEV